MLLLRGAYISAGNQFGATTLASSVAIEPGLSESLGGKSGLRDGSNNGTIEKLVSRVQSAVDADAASPLVGASELQAEETAVNPQCMLRCHKLVQRLLRTHKAAEDYPMLLVGHGASGWGVVQSFLHDAVPTWDKKLCWPMTTCVVLEDDESGSWHIVGHALPIRTEDGKYEC